MFKQVQFKGRDESGNIFCQPLLDGGLEKTAAIEGRSKLHPKVRDFISAIRPTKNGIYVLVNALGAGEYWGSNVNGDLFPEAALIHAPEMWEKLPVYKMREVAKDWEYGFPTFMNAAPYRHHQNKDRSRAFGSVELAVWNPEMHRVELVVYLDRELCKKFDAYDVIERIERGEFPDVSMGCKVPYDVCTICEHKSKTRRDYCDHAATMMNVILPDGRKVAVRNDFPRFFDISFVFIGADKTAKVMAKLAQQGEYVCMGDFCTIPRASIDVAQVFTKVAEVQDFFTLNPLEDFLKLANDPIQKRRSIQGISVSVEWPKGTTRKYYSKSDPNKVTFEKKMLADYGYIPSTTDADGEQLDCYVGPNPNSDKIFIIDQLKDDGSHDERKVMIGYDSKEEAKASYLAHMPPRRLGKMEETDVETFKEHHLAEAKQKEAHACSCGGSCGPCSSLPKIASQSREKRASHRKLSELTKSIPAGPFTKETLPRLESTEKDIPKNLLDQMGDLDLGAALSTAGLMGMVLKPAEFQRVILIRIGEKPLADEMDKEKKVFAPTEEVDESIPIEKGLMDEGLKKLLMSMMGERSIAAPALRRRTMRIAVISTPTSKTESKDPVMKKIAAAYNGYRSNLIKKATQIRENLVTDSQLRSYCYGQSMVEAFAGGVRKTASADVMGPESFAYLVGAYQNPDVPISKEVVTSLAQTGAFVEAAA